MIIETTLSLLTVVFHAKKIFHRTAAYLESRLAYAAAVYSVLSGLDRHLHPDYAFKISSLNSLYDLHHRLYVDI